MYEGMGLCMREGGGGGGGVGGGGAGRRVYLDRGVLRCSVEFAAAVVVRDAADGRIVCVGDATTYLERHSTQVESRGGRCARQMHTERK